MIINEWMIVNDVDFGYDNVIFVYCKVVIMILVCCICEEDCI